MKYYHEPHCTDRETFQRFTEGYTWVRGRAGVSLSICGSRAYTFLLLDFLGTRKDLIQVLAFEDMY